MKQWLIENVAGISFWSLFIAIIWAAEAGEWWVAFISFAALAGLVKLLNHLPEEQDSKTTKE